MPRQYDIHAAFLASIEQNPKGYLCLKTKKSSIICARRTGISARQTLTHGLRDTSQASRIRRPTEATTVIGSYVTWGVFSNGLSFAGYGLR